jgi:hypothetical protein
MEKLSKDMLLWKKKYSIKTANSHHPHFDNKKVVGLQEHK